MIEAISSANTVKRNYNIVNFGDNKLPKAEQKQDSSNLLTQFLSAQAIANTPIVNSNIHYKNDLKTLFNTNSAKILAILPRTFTAKDLNGNEYIDGNEKPGTFLSAINRLDEVKAQGFNTLHLLPINPTGKNNAMGTAGSVYSPLDLLKIDPVLIDKNDPRTDKEQFKAFNMPRYA